MTPIRPARAPIAVTLAIAVGACSPSPEPARHTVDEYRADAELRRAELARCANDPGTLGDTPDCINVREAARLEDRRSLRDLPPIQLPGNAKPEQESSTQRVPPQSSARPAEDVSTYSATNDSFWTAEDAPEVEVTGRREATR